MTENRGTQASASSMTLAVVASAAVGSLFGAALAYAAARRAAQKQLDQWRPWRRLPKRVILVRHGESEGNVIPARYGEVGDVHLQLTDMGWAQSRATGRALHEMLDGESVRFFVSPYVRTRETLRGVLEPWGGEEKVEWTEHASLREHEKGNCDTLDAFRIYLAKHMNSSPYFFRWPGGESFADMYDRAYQFRDTLHRYFRDRPDIENYVVVSHSLFTQIFLQRVLGYSVDEVESFEDFPNACVCVLEAPATDRGASRASDHGQEFNLTRLFVAKEGGGIEVDWRPKAGKSNVELPRRTKPGFTDRGSVSLHHAPRMRVIRTGAGPITSDRTAGNGCPVPL